MSLETISQGIATRLLTISGLKVYSTDALPNAINQFPAAIILPGATEYNAMFSGDANYIFRVLVLISKQDTPSALGKLLDYIELSGVYSIKGAIDGDATLSGSADDSRVSRNLGLGTTIWGGQTYLSSEFEILVWK